MLLDFYEKYLGEFSNAWSLKQKNYNIQVLEFKNQPFANVNTYITLGLSHYSLNQKSKNKIRQELIFSINYSYSNNEIASLLLTLSEGIVASSNALMKGETIELGKTLIDNVKCNSVFVTNPGFFEESFDYYKYEEGDVYLCWLIPILDEEKKYILQNGWSNFEHVLEKITDINLFWDLSRKSFLSTTTNS
ncbi:MAG: suppressor of fused domain protein [Chitinophagaceae bacterium]